MSGALASLGNSQWLSSTAIVSLLEAGCGPETRLFDSGYVTMQAPEAMFSKPKLRLRNEHTIWLIPLNHNNRHWTLAIIDIGNAVVEHYDPLSVGINHRLEALENFIRSFSTGEEEGKFKPFSQWKLRGMPCPAQSNNFDYGIYVVLFTYHRLLGLPIPPNLDLVLWRKVLSCSLNDNTSDGRDTPRRNSG